MSRYTETYHFLADNLKMLLMSCEHLVIANLKKLLSSSFDVNFRALNISKIEPNLFFSWPYFYLPHILFFLSLRLKVSKIGRKIPFCPLLLLVKITIMQCQIDFCIVCILSYLLSSIEKFCHFKKVAVRDSSSFFPHSWCHPACMYQWFSPFLLLSNNPCMDVPLSQFKNCSFVLEHFGPFCFGAMIKLQMNILVQVFVWT